MTNDDSSSHLGEKVAYIKLFDALAGHNLLLEANPPHFTILAATQQRLQEVGMKKEAVIGKALFEAHPGNSSDPTDNGVSNLRSSLDHVLLYKEMHQLPVQRYDLPDEQGGFSEKYWRASNRPVLNEKGEVAYIIHTAEEITHEIKAQRQEARLKYTEQAYSLFMQAPFAIHIFTGPELIIDLANPLTLELWGRKEGVTGKRFLDVLPELKGQGYEVMMQEVMQTGKPRHFYEVELTLNRPGKASTGYFNFIYQPYYKEGKAKAESILIIASEVTEQVLAKKQASKSEQSLSFAIEIAELGIFTIDLTTSLATYSSQVMDWFGFSQPSLSLTKVFSKIHFEDVAMAIETIERSIAGEWDGRHDFVYRVVHPNTGMVKYLRSIGHVQHENGVPVSISGIIQDVTKDTIATRKLEESEARFRNTVMQAPVAIAIFRGPKHVIELANEEHLKIWGRTAEEVIGIPLFEALPEAAGQGFEELLAGVLTTGKAFHADELHADLVRNGVMERVYFNFVYEALREEDGSVSGVIVTATEITEQVRARKKVEDSEAKLKSLIAAAPIGIGLFIGRDLVIEHPNQEFIDIVGKGPDIAGKQLIDVMPELIAHGQPYLKILDDVFTSGTMYQSLGDPVNIMRHGVMHHGFYNIYYVPLFDAEGKVYGIMDIATDVTEQIVSRQRLSQSEKNFRNMILQAPVAMCILKEPDYTVEIANERMFEIWGKTAEDMMNKPIFEGLPEAKEQGLEDLLLHVYTTGETFRAFEMPVNLPRNGKLEPTYLNFVYEPFYDASGNITGIIAVAVDATEQVLARHKIEEVVAQRTKELAAANENLQAVNKELQRSNANLEEFAYAASHDLKEPIRKITFFSHQLKDQLADRLRENEKFYFGRIEHATERMGNLIDDLLLYSHVSQRPHEMESIDLNVKVQRVLEDLELDIAQKKAIINVGKLPVVQGYRRQLQQLFQNLLSNALKYSKADEPPRIEIASSKVNEKDQAYHVIKVKDNGIGFSQEYAEKIFQMFARLHGKNEYSGTGVGLSIVKKVVENHHGFIRVESEPGTGSTFRIYLPSKVL